MHTLPAGRSPVLPLLHHHYVGGPQDDLERHAIAPVECSPLAVRVRRPGKPHRRQPGAALARPCVSGERPLTLE